MKAFICAILSSCMSVGFIACNAGEEGVPALTPFEKQYGEVSVMWDAPHQSLFNFKGSPLIVQVTEEAVDDDLSVFNTIKKYIFDRQGHLLEYNPASDLSDARLASIGEWGTAGNMTKYTYEYGANGKLIKVIEWEPGSDPVTYQLEYGSHAVYVPFPLSFGNLPLFLIKGLLKVEGDNGFKYEYDGESAVSETVSWTGVTRTEYIFRGAFPYKCMTLLARGDKTLQQIETIYAFGEKGQLMGTALTITGDEAYDVRKQSFIYALPWLQIKEAIYDNGFGVEKYLYDYTEEGFPVSATKNDGVNNVASVRLNEYQFDGQGNWIYAERVVEGYFNDFWPEGTMKLKQEFSLE